MDSNLVISGTLIQPDLLTKVFLCFFLVAFPFTGPVFCPGRLTTMAWGSGPLLFAGIAEIAPMLVVGKVAGETAWLTGAKEVEGSCSPSC